MRWTTVAAVVLAILAVAFIRRNTNNVCKTFADYYSNRDQNENCYYNPDHELAAPDIIKRHGYPVETHHVTTKDGYILTLFRIPHGKTPKSKPGPPVLIGHGFALNAGAFVTSGKKSLGFVLAEAGYDVWLGSFRGTRYSRNHTHLKNTDSEYWNFSFEEIALYDLRAKIDLVNQVTKQKIIYIGYSMGTTAGFLYGATYPDTALEKVKIFVALAPAAFTSDRLPVRIFGYIWNVISYPIQALTNGEVYPRPFIPMGLYKYVCLPFPIQMEVCLILDMMLLGYNYEQNDPETLPIILQHNNDAVSVKTTSHITQITLSKAFRKFDYGPTENKRVYGSTEPPDYDLSNAKVPYYLIAALNDGGMTPEDVRRSYNLLPERVRPYDIYFIKDPNFNHLDIVWGKDAPALVFKHLTEFLDSLKK